MSLVAGTAAIIKTTVSAVANVGVVHDYDPFPAGDWAAFVSNFTATISGAPTVRAWTIRNLDRRTVPISIAAPSEVQRVELDWLVRGFMALNTEGTSDTTWRDLLEAVTEAINHNRTLAGAPECIDHDPADYVQPNNGAPIALGDTVCHYGEVTFTSYHHHVISVV